MITSYKPHGVCSRQITIETDGDTILSIEFEGGCNGNLKGIALLCKGLKKQEVIDKLQGVKCAFKQTSCPDQLAKALSEIK